MTTEQILDVIENHTLEEELGDSIVKQLQSSTQYASVDDLLENWFEQYPFDTDTERILALMEHTGDDYYDCDTAIDKGNYIVLTDSEADDKWEESLNNYLDDLVLPDLPESAQRYFDRESWIEDAKMDGRGPCIPSYDSEEYNVTVGDETYYIYRIN